MRLVVALALLASVPTAVATHDQPSRPFHGGWAVLDGATLLGNTFEYGSVFGDSSTRNDEVDVMAQVAFRMNVTNLRVSASVDNCAADMQSGEAVSVVLRVNQADSILVGSCTFGADQGSFTLDTDTIELFPGDTLSLSYIMSGVLIGTRAPHIGVTFEGQVPAVVDMTNETLEAIVSLFPLLAFAAFILWAELQRNPMLYAAAAVLGVLAATTLPDLGMLWGVLLALAATLGRGAFFMLESKEEGGWA